MPVFGDVARTVRPEVAAAPRRSPSAECVARRWIIDNENGGHWVDFETLPEQTGALSSGERAYLHIAVSIGLCGTDGPTVNLSSTNHLEVRPRQDLVTNLPKLWTASIWSSVKGGRL